VGQTAQLTASAFTAAGASVASPSFTWSSSASSVALVDQAGLVRGVSAGTATISAQSSGVTGSTLVVVSAVSVPSAKDTIFTLPAQWVPSFITINAGQSVVFQFGGGIAHNAIFSKFNVAGSPADIQAATNATFSRTFNTRGKFPFECTLHTGMVGEITVQ
jgi:plastocyanin